MLLQAPDRVPEVEQSLKLAVKTWMKHPMRPCLNAETEKRWDGHIAQWILTPDLPLFVRCSGGKPAWEKGCRRMCEGRILIRCDNSPAQWIFRYACDAPDTSFEELKAAWELGQIPVAMVPPRVAVRQPDEVDPPALSKRGVNHLGWELSHRQPVRLQLRSSGKPLQAFEDHFRRLMSVSNMVLTPRRLGMNHLIDWYFRDDST
jgi:hypothetical protein